MWYEGAGMGDRRWLHADERGSVIAVSDGGGMAMGINSYDEWGIPSATNIGRFQYTGQAWLAELGLYHYKARLYSPTLGRFLQTDPIGYGDGVNWYAYVGNDPVNMVDPTGIKRHCVTVGEDAPANCQDRPEFRGFRGGGSGHRAPAVRFTKPELPPRAVDEPKSGKQPQGPCNSKLHRLGDGLEFGGDIISASGIGLALIGELAMPAGGGGGGAMIAEVGGLTSATGQLAQDIAFNRPGLETGARFVANAFGGKAAVGGIKMINRLSGNAFANAIGDYAAGKYIKGITDALDPERCSK